jgi:RimJ/RimL family protein N-acetyltransferase
MGQVHTESQIVTPRLHGLPLSERDFDDLHTLHQAPKVLDPFGAEPSTAEETREFLDRKLAHWHAHGFGIWMFRDPAGEFVGRCGIHRWMLQGRGEVELGYIVRSEYWSQGYATEMGTAVVEHAFGAPRAAGPRQLHEAREPPFTAGAREARFHLRPGVCGRR